MRSFTALLLVLAISSPALALAAIPADDGLSQPPPEQGIAVPPARVAEIYQITERMRAANNEKCLVEQKDASLCEVQVIRCTKPLEKGALLNPPTYTGQFTTSVFALTVVTPLSKIIYLDEKHDGNLSAIQFFVPKIAGMSDADAKAQADAKERALEADRLLGAPTSRKEYADAVDHFADCMKYWSVHS